MTINRLTLETKFSVKGDGSTFTGWASRVGVLDQVGDVVQAGAFADDLRKRGNIRPMLWQHDFTQPIGSMTLEEKSQGLRIVEGRIVTEVQRGREAAALLKHGNVLGGTSIGYSLDADGYSFDRTTGARLLKRIKLLEVSLVTFPALLEATIDSVKDDEEKLRDLLRSVRSEIVVARNRQEQEKLGALNALVASAQNEATNKELREALDALRAFRRTTVR